METLEEMDAWAAEHGIEAVRLGALPGGVFSGKSKAVASAWLQREDDRNHAARTAATEELERRAVEAAEASAHEARRSANAAAESAKWAKWSVIVAVVALLLAAWPFIDVIQRFW